MIIDIFVMISEERSRKHQRRCDDSYITKYHFFQNKTDYAFALWLYQTRITKENVHKYFNDIWLHSLHSLLSFQTSDEWLNLLHWISYDIDNEQWQSRAFCISFMYEEADAVQYDIKYQNIIDSLCFLLKHRLFEKDLVYAFIHHYNANNCQVYSEMHTIDWWWKTQEKLSDDITIVSLLLTTDKTVLTQHQSDFVAWSFYLIIENLSWCIRWAQFRSEMILQTFLLIINSDRDRIKSQIWHMTLSTILERKQHHSFKNMFDTHYIND